MTVCSYNGQGKDTLEWDYKWRDNQWQDSARRYFYYENDLKVLTTGEYFSSFSHSWVHYFRELSYYNESGLLDTLLLRIWNGNPLVFYGVFTI